MMGADEEKGFCMSDRDTEIAKRLRERFGDLKDADGSLSDQKMIEFFTGIYPMEYEIIALRVDVDKLMAVHHPTAFP